MQLETGPLPQLSNAWYDPTIETPDFSGLVNATMLQLEALEIEMDSWLDPAMLILDAIPWDGFDTYADNADLFIQQLQGDAETGPIATMDASYQDSVNSFVGVYQVIPGEAWAAVPPPQNYTGAAAQAPGQQQLTAQIVNLTNATSGTFQVDDNFQIQAAIAQAPGGASQFQNVPIAVDLWLNNLAIVGFTLGNTDANGTLACGGFFRLVDEGDWRMLVYATLSDGSQISAPELSWHVWPPPGGTPAKSGRNQSTSGLYAGMCAAAQAPPPLTFGAVLQNNVNPGSIFYHVGDSWTLTVYGPPGDSVVIGGTFNGNALAPQTLGTIDQGGTLVVNGVMDPSTIGTWNENYTIGGQLWVGRINFYVQQ